MDQFFPLGFPGPTAFYLTLYVATFALHQAFMHYVLAGSMYVAWATLFPGPGETPRWRQPLAAALRDWMPFALSAAITAGVAPLLFVQILHPTGFYTANLLLGWRWMIVVPVLVAAFYLLYLIKSQIIGGWPQAARAATVLGAAGSFLFVGFCWTANHLVANQAASWPEVYVTGDLPLPPLVVTARMVVWIGGAFCTLSVAGGWQLAAKRSLALRVEQLDSEATMNYELRRLAMMGLGGVAIAAIAAAVYIMQLPNGTELLLSPAALPYTALAVLGGLLLCGASIFQLRSGALDRGPMMASTLGWLLGLVGVSVLREIVRLSQIDLEPLFERHSAAADVGGFAVFLLVGGANLALIVVCLRIVRPKNRSQGA